MNFVPKPGPQQLSSIGSTFIHLEMNTAATCGVVVCSARLFLSESGIHGYYPLPGQFGTRGYNRQKVPTSCVRLTTICYSTLKSGVGGSGEPKHIFMLMGVPEGHGCFGRKLRDFLKGCQLARASHRKSGYFSVLIYREGHRLKFWYCPGIR